MEAVKKFENWAAPIVLIMAAVLLVWLVVKAKGLGSMLHKPSKFETFHEFWIVFIPSLTSNIFILSKLISLVFFQVQLVFGQLLR
jgi:NCS1 family nucleobase:cation symporter-1